MANMRILQDGTKVLVLMDGRLVAEMPWQAALQASAAIHTAAKKAEEWENAVKIARDQAILMRAGAPLGLTSHPEILAEAVHVAQNDRDLRRFMPSIKSTEVWGTPTVVNGPGTNGKPQIIVPGGIPSGEAFGLIGSK